jgi:hypothetical protein
MKTALRDYINILSVSNVRIITLIVLQFIAEPHFIYFVSKILTLNLAGDGRDNISTINVSIAIKMLPVKFQR